MLIRRAMRLGGASGPIQPMSGMYPYKAKEMGGWNLYPGQGPYSIIEALKGNQPIVGHIYRTETYHGHVVTRSFDLEKHFNTQDRYETVSWKDRAKFAFIHVYMARSWSVCWLVAIWIFLFCRYRGWRREPNEISVDRDMFWKNFDSMNWGVYFDHHRFDHMLRARRANKWAYHDVTLDVAH